MKVGEYADQCSSLLLDCSSQKLRRRISNLYGKYEPESMVSFTRVLLGEYKGKPPSVRTVLSPLEDVTDCDILELYRLYRQYHRVSSVAEIAYRRTDNANRPSPDNEVVGSAHHLQTTSSFSIIELDDAVSEIYTSEKLGDSLDIIKMLFRQCTTRREVKWVFYAIMQDIQIGGEYQAVKESLADICKVDVHRIEDVVSSSMGLSGIYQFYLDNGQIPTQDVPDSRMSVGI